MFERGAGLVPSPEDKRDYMISSMIPIDKALPKAFSWKLPLMRNQGQYGTCVGFGTANLKNAQEHKKKTFKDKGLSPLFIYSECKKVDGIPNSAGTYIRIGMKILQKKGTCTEQSFPYSLLTNTSSIPSASNIIKNEALKYKIESYATIPFKDLITLKKALLNSPVVAGFMTGSSLHNPIKGHILAPTDARGSSHCMLITGYDDKRTFTFPSGVKKTGFVEIANSWGTSWGDKGFGYVAYEDLFKQAGTRPFCFEMWSSVDREYQPEAQPTKPIAPHLFKMPDGKLYRVQIGGFSFKKDCENFMSKVVDAGFSVSIVQVGSEYRIQCGASYGKIHTNLLLRKLKKKGFSTAFIAHY